MSIDEVIIGGTKLENFDTSDVGNRGYLETNLPDYFFQDPIKDIDYSRYNSYDDYPTQLENAEIKTIKVTLTENITHYRSVERAVKYDILFVVLNIITLLIYDLLGGGIACNVLPTFVIVI